MPTGAKHVDRLLPRHGTEGLELSWNVHMARVGLFRKEEDFRRGVIRDISLEGALVHVHGGEGHEVGDEVPVRFRGLDGTAVIRHIQRTDDGKVAYGVHFRPGREFKLAIDLAVGELRGDPHRNLDQLHRD